MGKSNRPISLEQARRQRQRRRAYSGRLGWFDAFKWSLPDEEREDLEGAGTRTFGGLALRWHNGKGTVHACEAAEVVPAVMLLWTLCGMDLPADANYFAAGPVNCPWCRIALSAANTGYPVVSRRPGKA
jgi:hypothetical protein